ncbi:MAG: polyphosphate kinase 1, partial [Gemmatimonadetes bacterium]|nr:polyphosphate kinase 1 [Gemmatimonadota bacterium]
MTRAVPRTPLRFEAGSVEVLERVAAAPLPPGLTVGAERRRFHRDQYLDTADGALQQRGVSCRFRSDPGPGWELSVKVREPGPQGEADAHALIRARVQAEDQRAALAGDSEPARILRAIVDPVRLAPVLAVATDRRVRTVRWRWWPRDFAELAFDAVSIRAGEPVAEFHEIKLRRLTGGALGLAWLARYLSGVPGLRASATDKFGRARHLLQLLEANALAQALDASHEVAVLPFNAGLLGLAREGGALRVLGGAGAGEDACRQVLRAALGSVQGQVRLLGSAPATGVRPATEVWLARRLRLDRTGARLGTLEWVPFDRLTDLVGSRTVRDARTLAALHLTARSDLMRERPTWEPSAPASPAEASAERSATAPFINPDLSLLAFHARVLASAEDPRVPLLERLRFLAIASANLDEFFQVRVGAIKEDAARGGGPASLDGLSTAAQLDAIGIHARRLYQRTYRCFSDTLAPALREQGVTLVRWDDLTAAERDLLQDQFREQIYPVVTPLAATPGHPFPYVPHAAVSLAVMVRHADTRVKHFATVNLPRRLPRFLSLPGGRFIPVEAVLCANIPALFSGVEVLQAHTFRVTRSADVGYEDQTAPDLLQAVDEALEQRPFNPVIRLEVERAMPREMRALLLQEFRFEAPGQVSTLSEADVYDFEWLPGLVALKEIAALPLAGLHWPVLEAATPNADHSSFLAAIAERDLLVHFPYDSYQATVERFVDEAADDSAVEALRLTLYRTHQGSRLRQALLRARALGKEVVALVEITARFDEGHNIEWARELRAAGVHVVYGQVGLKTHAKLIQVVRRETEGLRRYTFVGTGNFNAKTASEYTDLGLFTADEAIGTDVTELLHDLTGHAGQRTYRRILVAPTTMLAGLSALIERETEHARAGRPASIRAKMNGLDDPDIIAALYRAAQAGVDIRLVVRA